MSVTVLIGLLCALATAFASILGFLYKHRGAVASPPVSLRRPVRTSLRLFRSPWYSLGIAIALTGWGFHVAALALAPISLVKAVISGGLVMLTVTADRLFAHEVTRREWIGVALAALGLAFLAASLDGVARDAYSDAEGARLAGFIVAVGGLATVVAWRGRRAARAGVVLAASAGMYWAASDVAIKALTPQLADGPAAVLADPLAAVIALASFAGLVVSARSLQLGKAVPVIAVTSVAANSLTILSGPLVFAEPLPETTLGFVLRVLAFALIITAAALTPAPAKAAHLDDAETDSFAERVQA